MNTNPDLLDHDTATVIRPATRQEWERSVTIVRDGDPSGAFDLDGRTVYADGDVWHENGVAVAWSWDGAAAELRRHGWSAAAINDAFDGGERGPAVWTVDDIAGAEIALRSLADSSIDDCGIRTVVEQ